MKIKYLRIFPLGVCLLLITLNYTYLYLTPHYTPNVRHLDLKPLLEQDSFSEADYHLLFEQTGLAKPIIDELTAFPDFKDKILDFQKHYLSDIKICQTYMPPATFCQLIDSTNNQEAKAFTIAPYHKGYIFFTDATHSYGWRHGHVGLVVDEVHGLTLEALCPGSLCSLQSIDKWEYYPTFEMLRLKKTSLKELELISNYALEELYGLPYSVLSSKKQTPPKSSQCALLIWQAFNHFGYDLDATGGHFVSPKDIARSPLLEVLQIYGLKPNKDW